MARVGFSLAPAEVRAATASPAPAGVPPATASPAPAGVSPVPAEVRAAAAVGPRPIPGLAVLPAPPRVSPVPAEVLPAPARARLLVTALALLLAGCASTPVSGPSGTVRIVAAENFWGSVASQLAGTEATVHSIIVDPAQDPHSYEPTAGDARTLATAQLAIVNGVGYDPWASKLLSANPTPGRLRLTVGDLLGLKDGDNPHRWYDPADVEAVANAITADLEQLDPKHSAYFDQQRAAFENPGLARYHAIIARIKARYGGAPVGASESIFALQAPALGLRLLTPSSFMRATGEGTDVTAQDTIATQRQITAHQIKVWIYNAQNATPAILRLNALARAQRIPIATVTETLSPASDSFEQWQVAQLQGIAGALHQATGR